MAVRKHRNRAMGGGVMNIPTKSPAKIGVISALGTDLSLRRVVGMACGALWVLVMFYGVSLFSTTAEVRSSLYLNMFIAMIALAVFLPASAALKNRLGHAAVPDLVMACAIVACVGSLADAFADAGTPAGMLFLGIGAILCGVGASGIVLGWFDILCAAGSRVALIELSFAGLIAFLVGFLAFNAGNVAAALIAAALPCASGWFAHGLLREGDAHGNAPCAKFSEVSGSARWLFFKIAAGAFLIGVIQGFFDLLLGYDAYAVFDVYGIYLFMGGFFSMFAACAVAMFLTKDGVFAAYRVSMFLLCLGCLLMPFIGDGTTYYSGAIVFSGYACFGAALCVICIEAVQSFRVSVARMAALVFSALFVGQVVGFAVAFSADGWLGQIGIASVVVVAVSMLFVAQGFMLTELDLVKVGVGDVGAAAQGEEGCERDCARSEDGLCEAIVQRYGLTPRESDVLPLLLQGRTISRIQETLFISAGTVSTHIRHIYQKTGVSNRQDLMDLVEREFSEFGSARPFLGHGPED